MGRSNNYYSCLCWRRHSLEIRIMYNFTPKEVMDEVRKTFDEPMCLDFLEDAMTEKTIEDAAQVIILDSAYWNDTW